MNNIIKFDEYNKIFESLPRQSSIDQFKKVRKLIKKSRKVKIGPNDSSMKGDIGDLVMSDLKKHKMNNFIKWNNPIDYHIDTYELFVKSDSKKGLGYKP